MTVYQRACDLYFGLVYDLPWHCRIIKKIKEALNNAELRNGELTMFFGSLHIYKKNKSDFQKFLRIRK